MFLLNRFPKTLQYQAKRGHNERVIENCEDYVRRMRSGPLRNGPEALLAEWLVRHSDQTEDYAILSYDAFQFELASWPADRIPGAPRFGIQVRVRAPHHLLEG